MFHPVVDFIGLQWLIVPFIVFGRYAVICLVLFTLFYTWKRRAWLRLKIQQHFPQGRDYWREIGFSALTSIVFAGVTWACLGTGFRAYTQFYRDIHAHSIAWLVASIPLTLLIHDTYFYWIHRLMHLPAVYRRVHLIHHKSVNPSPWAAYSFHPVEAILEAGIVPILLLIMPLHPISFLAFVTLMLWFNIYGHLGYELFSPKTYTHPIGQWINSSIYHNLHHEKFHGNYGLYFTFWDKFCGTLRSDSAGKVAEVHGRNPSPARLRKEKVAGTVDPQVL